MDFFYKQKKPRVLITGVGCQYGGTEVVVSRFVGALSDRFSFDTISYEPKKQAEYSLGENREILIPMMRTDPFCHTVKMRRFFRDYASEYCALWHNANSFASIDALRLATKSSIPVRICHFHNVDYLGDGLSRFTSLVNKTRAGNLASLRLACSDEAGQFAFGRKPFEVLNNAFDVNEFDYNEHARDSVRKELGIENCFVIGSVGRLAEQKNQLLLIKALPEILRRRPNAALVLVGDGPLRESLISEAKALGVYENIRLTGPRRDVAALLSAFDVFAFPSTFEGLGVAAVEAQANGLPCVISDRIPSAAIASKSVIVIPAENESLWAESLCSLNRAAFVPSASLSDSYDIEKVSSRLAEYFLGCSSG